jgi:LPS O-antigen subunit length determinant protein (WzzB/FepE family)
MDGLDRQPDPVLKRLDAILMHLDQMEENIKRQMEFNAHYFEVEIRRIQMALDIPMGHGISIPLKGEITCG